MEIKKRSLLHNIIQLSRCQHYILGHQEKRIYSIPKSSNDSSPVIPYHGSRFSPIFQLAAMLLVHNYHENDIAITFCHALSLYIKHQQIVEAIGEAPNDNPNVPTELWTWLGCFFLAMAMTHDEDEFHESVFLNPLISKCHLGHFYMENRELAVSHFQTNTLQIFLKRVFFQRRLDYKIIPQSEIIEEMEIRASDFILVIEGERKTEMHECFQFSGNTVFLSLTSLSSPTVYSTASSFDGAFLPPCNSQCPCAQNRSLPSSRLQVRKNPSLHYSASTSTCDNGRPWGGPGELSRDGSCAKDIETDGEDKNESLISYSCNKSDDDELEIDSFFC